MQSSIERGAPPVLGLRRDYTPGTVGLPGMRMGAVSLAAAEPGQQAGDLFARGVRHVELGGVVDVTDPAAGRETVAALALVRDLTSYGIVVSWTIRLAEGDPLSLLLGHLYPPADVLGTSYGAEVVQAWRRKFYVGKCFWRRGPGFIEVRDRRSARLARMTIADPGFITAIEAMTAGAELSRIPRGVLAELSRARLAHAVGEHAWWVPYRIRRWPSPPLAV